MFHKKYGSAVAVLLFAWPVAAHAADILGAIFSGLDQVISFLLDFFTGGAMTIVGAIMFFIILLGKILMYIGLAFGPLILAMAPFRLTRNMAIKWGEYMFGAVMYTSVATAVIMLCGTMLKKLHDYNAVQADISIPATYISLVSIMIAIIAGLIMWRVPSITAELFGGIGLHVRSPKMSVVKKGGNDKTDEKLDQIIEKLNKPR